MTARWYKPDGWECQRGFPLVPPQPGLNGHGREWLSRRCGRRADRRLAEADSGGRDGLRARLAALICDLHWRAAGGTRGGSE